MESDSVIMMVVGGVAVGLSMVVCGFAGPGTGAELLGVFTIPTSSSIKSFINRKQY